MFDKFTMNKWDYFPYSRDNQFLSCAIRFCVILCTRIVTERSKFRKQYSMTIVDPITDVYTPPQSITKWHFMS